MDKFLIKHIDVKAYRIPTDMPESDGTLEWDSTTIVIVQLTAGGKTGIGYTYSHHATAVLIKEKLADIIRGKNPFDIPECWIAMVKSIRNLGRPGISSNAIAAVDSALWDLKAKLLSLPLTSLLGQLREGVEIYGSGGFTSYSIRQLSEQLHGWANEGITKVKMKIGREPDKDIERIKAARDAIGNGVELFVDANGAYNTKQALAKSEQFTKYNVTWFEEPVSSDNLKGLRFLKNNSPSSIEIAAGEYGYDDCYFQSLINENAVDVLQADATRCAGITGFISAGQICKSNNFPLSAHTAPTIHLHPCCSLFPVRHIEYFHDHVRIEKMFFDGFPKQRKGKLYPDLTRPGLGIELKKKDAQNYLI
jgi:L-alanine-DL-glutamate epimerase-like enolase superfamily enzyme